MKVAAIQYCAGADWPHNRAQLEQLLPAAEGAKLVLLPENFACYGGDYRRLAEDSAEVLQWLATWAKRLDTTLVAGSLPQALRADGSAVPAPRVRAACLVIAPDGRVQARYDKLHLFDVEVTDAQGRYCESAVFEPGDKLVLTDIAQVPTGLAICYDLRFASLAMALAQRGARLLLYPQRLHRRHRHGSLGNLAARARRGNRLLCAGRQPMWAAQREARQLRAFDIGRSVGARAGES